MGRLPKGVLLNMMLLLAAVLLNILSLTVPSEAQEKKSAVHPDSVYIMAKNLIATAYQYWSIDECMNARQFIERNIMLHDDYLIRYYMGLADYRLAVFYLRQPDSKKGAERFVDDGIENLERSIKMKPDFSESYILLNSLLGLKISLNPITGPIRGIKASNQLEKAKQLDENNPRLLLVEGISLRNTPRLFGGDSKKALDKFKEAIQRFQLRKEQSPIYPDWGYGEAYGWLIQLYIASDSLDTAQRYINEALAVDPSNNWVRYVIQQQLAEKKQKKEGEKK